MANIDIKKFNEIVEEVKKIEMECTYKQIADIIYQIIEERKKQNITQIKLSDMTGIPQTTISRIETFISTPTLPILIKIANALQLKITLN